VAHSTIFVPYSTGVGCVHVLTADARLSLSVAQRNIFLTANVQLSHSVVKFDFCHDVLSDAL
jgi:hypothetical protein